MQLPSLPQAFRYLAFCAACLTSLPLIAQSDSISTLQKTAVEWARLKDALARFEASWEPERQWLQSALSAHIAQEERLLQKKNRLQSEFELAAQGYLNESAAAGEIQDELSAIEEKARQTADSLRALRPYLPPRLSNALDLLFQSLAEDGRSASERIDIATSIINRCLKFNERITFAEESITLEPSSGNALIEVVYWGLSHGYAFDRSTGTAYFGNPAAGGWHWQPDEKLSQPVADLIEIFAGEKDPVLVLLPAEIVDVETLLSRENAP